MTSPLFFRFAVPKNPFTARIASAGFRTASAPRLAPRLSSKSISFSTVGLGLVGAGALLCKPAVQCQPLSASSSSETASLAKGEDEFSGPQIPQSNISLASLGFGSVAGICCGIFVVKGLKAVAFLLGGLFVTLQWMSSKSMARVNWGSVESGYNSAVDRLSGSNVQKGKGNLKKVFDRSIQFLLADFPQRATFLAGLTLGMRLG